MSIIDSFYAGGPFMYGILTFLIFTVAFIVERAYALFMAHKDVPTEFRDELYQKISKGNFTGALEYANEFSAQDMATARVARTGIELRMLGAGEEELQARMDEKLTQEISHVDKRTSFLAMFGNVSTLLGLLGTVTGLIASFAGVASATPAERATLLGQGISEALNTTAFGLVAAIPALIAFAIFQNKTDKIIGNISDVSAKIYHDLIFNIEVAGEHKASKVVIPKKERNTNTEVRA